MTTSLFFTAVLTLIVSACTSSQSTGQASDATVPDDSTPWRFDAKLVPEGCKDFLKPRLDSTKAFDCQPASVCAYLDDHPQLEVLLFLRVNKAKRFDPLEGQISYSKAEADHNRSCLAKFLSAAGLKPNLNGAIVEQLQDVEVIGQYRAMLRIVRELDSVWDVEVVCQDKARCEDCGALADTACLATPMCGLVMDAYKREGESCVPRAAACLPFDTLCSDKAPFGVRDPQGSCWILSASCIGFPSGWRPDVECEQREEGCTPDLIQK